MKGFTVSHELVEVFLCDICQQCTGHGISPQQARGRVSVAETWRWFRCPDGVWWCCMVARWHPYPSSSIIESKVGIDRILKKSRQGVGNQLRVWDGNPSFGASVTPPSAASSALSSPRQWCLCPAGWGNGCSETGQGLE